ncbi:hypothetical protein KVT40_005558 [Elsinoe batatas]|uniref:Uncharacterized protein n=1 Tax=Elsinoe batatas TaxID=2601811 RepID=A0A8K0L1S9_9PEZI|nr:hypothetical protein KVT40_005558 [Elsinoe batatas]
MAPDLNSVPSSPRQQRARTSQPPSTSNSRRPSQVMAQAQAGTSPAMHHSPVFAHSEHGMPIRHPRPLTAAELHLELEKEQEAVVNRLTRELTALRAQHSASVASNHSLSSTTSTPLIDPTDPNPAHQITGPTHPTPSRRHRSSSSSISRAGPNPSSTSNTHPPPHGQSQASADRAAAATTRSSISRNPSISASASGTSTPARISSDTYNHSYTNAPGGLTLPHRPALSHAGSAMSGISVASTAATQGSGTGSVTSTAGTPVGSLGLALAGAGVGAGTSAPSISGPGISSPSFIDAEKARQELESVKIENEALREKVKALERQLRRRRESGTSEAMSLSTPGQVASTPASVLGTGTGVAIGDRIPGSGGVNVSAWAAAQGSVAGVAGPRERSESQSTEASVRRRQGEGGLGETTQEERDEVVGVGESAGSKGVR